MSMSTHVVGFKPADEKWKKMRAAYDSCLAAGISIPNEVLEFFDWTEPDSAGVEVPKEKLPIREWIRDDASGFELDVTKLDPDIKIIRFYNCW